MESKTPRTDDREFAAIDLKPSSRVVYASFARQLETELAESGKKAFAYKTALELTESELIDARAEIERKDKLIEQMREALKAVVSSAPPGGPLWHGSAEIEKAVAAIKAAERGDG